MKRHVWKEIWNFYVDGFRRMTWGRTLWIIILVKLFIIFVLLKLFFFPDFLSKQEDKPQYVGSELIIRSNNSPN